MSDLHPSIKAVLDPFENVSGSFDYFDVANAIQKVFNENTAKGFREQTAVIGEVIAFWFMEDYPGKERGWGTYYGPMMVLSQQNGMFIENPSIQQVTQEMLAYWEGRAKEARHPLLRNRYADLVWDFSKEVTGKGANIEIACTVIDSAIEIVNSKLHEHETDLVKRLERALFVSLRVNDTQRVERVRDAIIALEDLISSDGHPGTWGFSFDLLLDKKKILLTPAQEGKILSDMENRLKRISDLSKPGTGDVYVIEMATARLTQFYRKKNQLADVQRVLRVYRDVVIEMSRNASSLLGMAWLQKVHSVLLDFGMKKDSGVLDVHLREVGKKSVDEMERISVEIPIPPEKIEKHIDAIVSGSLEEALGEMAFQYVPRKETATDSVREMAKHAPLTYLIPRTIVDSEGRPLAKVGPLHEDLEGYVVQHISQTMGIFSSLFLRPTMEKVLEKYKPDDEEMVEYLYNSPVFSENKRGLIATGIGAYLKGDYVSAVHVLIPQFEEAIRSLARIVGSPILKPNKNGGYSFKVLDELLREDEVSAILGEDVVCYFRVLFSDQRGWNLRNEVCHGLMNDGQFSAIVADRVFHALLVLAQARGGQGEKA